MSAVLTGLDGVRAKLLRSLQPMSSYMVAARGARVGAAWLLLMWVQLAMILLAPLWVLALGPVILGIPHALADLRYLVIRPGLHRRGLPFIIFLVGAVAAAVYLSLSLALAAVSLAVLVHPGELWKRVSIAALAGCLAVVCALYPNVSAVTFAHVHNLIGVTLFCLWRRRWDGFGVVALLSFFAIYIALIFGAGDTLALSTAALLPNPSGASNMVDGLVWGVPQPFALGLLLAFGFAQGTHYVVWLRLIPEEDRRACTAPPLRRVARGLITDFGRPLLIASALGLAALCVWAVFDLVEARTGYLRMAVWHGYIELFALALIALGRLHPASDAEDALA